MSPELIKSIKSDKYKYDIDKTNIFSLGIICLQIIKLLNED